MWELKKLFLVIPLNPPLEKGDVYKKDSGQAGMTKKQCMSSNGREFIKSLLTSLCQREEYTPL
jgi:hypothetical protein